MSVQSAERREYVPHIVTLIGPPLVGKTTLGREVSGMTNHAHLDIDEQGRRLEGILEEVLGPFPRSWAVNSVGVMMPKYALLHGIAMHRLTVLEQPVLLTATYSHGTYEDALRGVLADTYKRFAGLNETPLIIFELDTPVGLLAKRIAERNAKGSDSPVDSLQEAMDLRRKFVHFQGDDVVKVDTGLPIEQNIAQILEVLEPFRKVA